MIARSSARHFLLHVGVASIAVAMACAIPICVASICQSPTVLALIAAAMGASCFVVGFVCKLVRWLRAPIAFNIALTVGQKSEGRLYTRSRLGCPDSKFDVVLRAVVDGLLFRPLLRATPSAKLSHPELCARSSRWTWFFSALFHGSLVIVAIRHVRLFLTPVPQFVAIVANADSWVEPFIPRLHLTGITMLAGLAFLTARRLTVVRVRYLSLAGDYIPLLLLAAIGTTGLLARHVAGTDLTAVKAFLATIANREFPRAEHCNTFLLTHVFLVDVLMAYFPLSKLMHMPGVLMSPPLTLTSDSRRRRHINVWNPEVRLTHYAEYEATYRERMIEAGIPVEGE